MSLSGVVTSFSAQGSRCRTRGGSPATRATTSTLCSISCTAAAHPDSQRESSPLSTRRARRERRYSRREGANRSLEASPVTPGRGITRLAAEPPRGGCDPGRRDRPPPRAPASRRPLRGLAPQGGSSAPPGRRPGRPRRPGCRRCARQCPPATRRLSRREPIHDVGVQVRPARGRGQAPKARLAGEGDPRSSRRHGARSRARGSSRTSKRSRASC